MMNKVLRVKIVEKVDTQERLSRRTGIDEAIISKIVREVRQPTIEQKRKISKALDTPQKELWEEEDK